MRASSEKTYRGLRIIIEHRLVSFLTILQRALRQAVNDGLIPRNSCAAVDPPQVRREEIQPLDRDQVRVLFETAREYRLETLFIVAVHCGLRQGELLGLRWDAVDLDAGTLQVRRTLSSGDFTVPKTAKSRRTVNLTPTAIESIKRHRERQAQEMMRAGALYQDQGLVGHRLKQWEEKETDVAVAAKLLELVFTDACDTVVLMTGDTDFAPAVKTARSASPRKDVRFAFPYARVNNDLRQIAPKSFRIRKESYANHQFPDPFVLSNGEKISKPSLW
jgi:uncharacterized LabA/DUF88 family protein